MNKRFTALITTLILSVFFSISASAYDVEVDGIYYLIPKKNVAIVTRGDKAYSGDITIPSSIKVNDLECTVREIEESAFSDCSRLTSVTIPNSVTSIGRSAFSICSGLTSVTIPNSVTSIGESAFAGCSSLTSITIPNSVTCIGGFAGCSSLTSITIPNSVTSIEYNAFRNCSSLTSVTIPNSVTSIGFRAFQDCSSLTSITIPNSVTSIGESAFRGCISLTSVAIPNSVTSIGEYTFYNCSSLTSITIPNSVTIIGEKAFANCSNLENVYCYAEKLPYLDYYIFDGSYIEYATLHVPSSALSYYQTKYPWSGFGTIKTLEGNEKKCETPTISFVDGELVYNCATEGVEYISEIKSDDINKFYTEKVSLAACYDISVTAMKTGYDNSDVATAKLYWLTSSGTLEADNINAAKIRGVVIQSADGFVTISGLNSNEQVDFFASDGKALGSAKAMGGTATFAAQSGTVVIAKIGKESLKIAVE